MSKAVEMDYEIERLPFNDIRIKKNGEKYFVFADGIFVGLLIAAVSNISPIEYEYIIKVDPIPSDHSKLGPLLESIGRDVTELSNG